VVLLLRHGQVIARKAYGLANVELGAPMKVDDRFRIASISKQITAVAVLQLVDEGKIDLSAPIATYLRDAPKAWAAVTVAQLLSHTSGLATRMDAPPETAVALDKATTFDELRKLLDKLPPHTPPGTEHAYNNWGYALLAQMLERLTHKPYCDYVKQRLLAPLGMAHTECADTHAIVAGLVTGYGRAANHALILPDSFPLNAPLMPAGGWVSTVDDLAKWAIALHGGKLLKPDSYARMIAPAPLRDGHTVSHYGLGTRIRTVDGRTIIAANGDVPGFHSEIAVDREADCIAIGLYNFELYNFRAPYVYFSRRLLAFARGRPLPELTAAADTLERYVGTYVAKDTARRQVTLEQGKLYSKEVGDPGRDELVPLGHGVFAFAEDDDTRLTFTDEHGAVTGVRITVDGSGDPGRAQTRQR
jgi:serine beta-lactamase-like protein LACTB